MPIRKAEAEWKGNLVHQRSATPRFQCRKFLRGQGVNHLDGCFITTLYKRRAEKVWPLPHLATL